MTNNNTALLTILRTSIWTNTDPSESRNPEPVPNYIRAELNAQAVEGLTAEAFPNENNLGDFYLATFARMIQAQEEVLSLLQQANIPVVIIKGTAAGIYYPMPYLRAYGDIDLLVLPDHYHTAIQLILNHGYVQDGRIGEYHTSFDKGKFQFELHQSLAGPDAIKESTYVSHYIRTGFDNIQIFSMDLPECTFPMLPWKQNGLILIWHFLAHLYNGIGLRHAIDWMMFVHCCLSSEEQYAEFREALENAGLLTLAKAVTRMCQLYLGLDENISWCKDADDELCAELMEFIMEQGNFGTKRSDDKVAKVLTRYRTPVSFLKGMQQKGLHDWRAIKNYPFLKPFAWLYTGVQGSKRYLTAEGRKKLAENQKESLRRRRMMDRLLK